MYIYIIELLLLWVFGLLFLKKYNSKVVFLICTFLMLALVLGARGNNVGEDTKHYIDVFNRANNISWKVISQSGLKTIYYVDDYGYADKIENGFLILCKIVHWFTDSAQFFLFVVAMLTCVLIAKFIYDNCEDVFLATYVFVCESTYMNMFNGIRQLLAMAIGISAYKYIKQKKIIPAILFILIAFYVHNSAIVLLVVLLLVYIPKRKESELFGYTVLAVFSVPLLLELAKKIVSYFLPRYSAYFENNYWDVNIGGTLLLWTIEVVCIFIMYQGRFRVDNTFNSSILIMFYLILEVIGLRYTAMSRLAWYFRIVLVMFFPDFEKYLIGKDKIIYRIIIYFILSVAFISYASVGSRTYSFWLQV